MRNGRNDGISTGPTDGIDQVEASAQGADRRLDGGLCVPHQTRHMHITVVAAARTPAHEALAALGAVLHAYVAGLIRRGRGARVYCDRRCLRLSLVGVVLLGASGASDLGAHVSVSPAVPVGAPAGRVAIPRLTTRAGGRALFKEIPHATRVVVGELRGAMGAIDDDHILATDASGVWSPSARAIIPSDRSRADRACAGRRVTAECGTTSGLMRRLLSLR